MTVDEYLAGVSEPQRTTLSALRDTLRDVLPDAEERLSYGVPAFVVRGKVVAGYAAFRAHCSYFPHSGSVLPALADELAAFDWSAGTLRFPIDRPLTRSLVERLVAVRMEQAGLT